MTIGYHDRINKPGFSYVLYMARRVTKFYPIHWLVLFIMVAMSWSSQVHDSSFWGKFTANFLLLQSFIPQITWYFSFNGPSWYLCNTLFYCLLFPFVLRTIMSMSKKFRCVFLSCCILLYILLVVFLPKDYQHAILYINPFVRLFDFVLGIFMGLFFLNQINKESKRHEQTWLYFIALVCFTFLALIVFGLFDGIIYNYVKWNYWIFICPLICSISLISVKKDYIRDGKYSISKVFQWGGKYSFTFYIIHLLCIELFAIICNAKNLVLWQTTIVTFWGTMIIAVLAQKYFVEPLGKFLMNKISNIK